MQKYEFPIILKISWEMTPYPYKINCTIFCERGYKEHSFFLQMRIYVYLFMDISKSCSQHLVSAGLATKWFSNDHKTVTHDHHFIDLKLISKKHVTQINSVQILNWGENENNMIHFAMYLILSYFLFYKQFLSKWT